METGFRAVCGFGDSVMKGIVVDRENSPVDGIKYKISDKGFAARCRRNLGIDVENFARYGGMVTHGMKFLNRYADKVKEADYVLFEYGGNDCDYKWAEISERPDDVHLPNVPIDVFTAKYRELIDAVKALGTQPVLLTLPVLDPERYFRFLSKGLNGDNILKWLHGSVLNIDRWHERYNMEIMRLGVLTHTPVIDITSVFLERRNFSDYLCEDGIHPNEAGHRLIQGAIVSYLRRERLA
jgi:lysophospholipase L1-like esterase